jgi:oxygen-independent coproporphyrinogen-3 oxidase
VVDLQERGHMTKAELERLLDGLTRGGFGRPEVDYGNQTVFPNSINKLWPAVADPLEIHRHIASTASGIEPRVYIHVPFCSRKCRYCCYFSVAGTDASAETYVSSIEREFALARSIVPDIGLTKQVYVGGGTPTWLPLPLLRRVFAALTRHLPLVPGASFTVETSPSAATAEKLAFLKESGATVLCLGVQSFDDRVLAACGRDHTRQEAVDAIGRVLAWRFPIFNVDLMYGLPGQTLEDWKDSVKTGIDLGVPEFSLYLLRVNAANRDRVRKQDDYFRVEVEMFEAAALLFEAAGYGRTRPHHWVKKDREDAWNRYRFFAVAEEGLRPMGGTSWGFGPAARSQIGQLLHINHESLTEYAASIARGHLPAARHYTATAEDRVSRFFIGKLGQKGEMSLAEFASTFGDMPADHRETLAALEALGVVKTQGDRVVTTESGALVFDCVERAFYPRSWRERLWGAPK